MMRSVTQRSLFIWARILLLSSCCCASVSAQTWTWSDSYIELAGGQSSSIIVDRQENLHVVYRVPTGGILRYAFRPAASTHWFKMDLEKSLDNFSTRIAVDDYGNPMVCYTPREMKYAKFDGHKWFSQTVDPGTGVVDYECSIRIAADGRPVMSWYWPSGGFRYGTLRDGVWLVSTIDGGPGDYAGKWNSMSLDASGHLQIAYSDFPGGELRYAANDGKGWVHTALDTQKNTSDGPRGMGVAMVLDANRDPWISYYDEHSLMVTHRANGRWTKQVVTQLPEFRDWGWKQFHSDIALDRSGKPHIIFESLSGLEHAWWNGSKWITQIILSSVFGAYYDNCMAMAPDGTIYVTYTDPLEHSLKLAVGRLSDDAEAAAKSATSADKP